MIKEPSLSENCAKTKLLCFSAILFFSASCAHTTYSTSAVCLADFFTGEKVLVAEMEGVPVNTSYHLYENSLDISKKAGLEPAYAVEEELNLRLYQVEPNKPDAVSLQALREKLGYDYLLIPTVSDRKEGEGVVSYDPDENLYYSAMEAYEDTDAKATISLMLYSTTAGTPLFELAAATTISAVAVPEKDGDKTLYNFSSSEMAMFKAYRKGLKKIIKKCQ